MKSEDNNLIDLLNNEYFFVHLNVREEIDKSFSSLISDKTYEEQIEAIEQLFSKIGKKTYHEIVGKVLKGFSKIQTSLFGIELEEKEGKRFRDHYIHTFNLYFFGSVMISQLLDQIKVESDISDFFKVKKENDDVKEAFSIEVIPYNIIKRLFFIWTFMVLYHDVGIPISHLETIRNRLNMFFENFGFILHEFSVEFKHSIGSRLDYFMNLITKMYRPSNNENGIKFENDNYQMSNFIDPHIKKIFLTAFDDKNHGVLSAICFYKCIIESLTEIGKDCLKYNNLILEQDITRIALAITLHDLYKYDINQQIFPISFKDFPLTFLLILMDQTQEYYRPEGISLNKLTKSRKIPEIKIVKVATSPLKFKICFTILYSHLDRENEVIEDFKNFKFSNIVQGKFSIDKIIQELDLLKGITNFKQVLESYWKDIETSIKERLKFGPNEPIDVQLKIKLDNIIIKNFYFM